MPQDQQLLEIRDLHGGYDSVTVLHGINLVAKGGRPEQYETREEYRRSFRGEWMPADIADLSARGFTLVRLGVIWAAVEPEPGQYDQEYLDYLTTQLDLLHGAGLAVLLDAHQTQHRPRNLQQASISMRSFETEAATHPSRRSRPRASPSTRASSRTPPAAAASRRGCSAWRPRPRRARG